VKSVSVGMSVGMSGSMGRAWRNLMMMGVREALLEASISMSESEHWHWHWRLPDTKDLQRQPNFRHFHSAVYDSTARSEHGICILDTHLAFLNT